MELRQQQRDLAARIDALQQERVRGELGQLSSRQDVEDRAKDLEMRLADREMRLMMEQKMAQKELRSII